MVKGGLFFSSAASDPLGSCLFRIIHGNPMKYSSAQTNTQSLRRMPLQRLYLCLFVRSVRISRRQKDIKASKGKHSGSIAPQSEVVVKNACPSASLGYKQKHNENSK